MWHRGCWGLGWVDGGLFGGSGGFLVFVGRFGVGLMNVGLR